MGCKLQRQGVFESWRLGFMIVWLFLDCSSASGLPEAAPFNVRKAK
jgi:hypothetical protein